MREGKSAMEASLMCEDTDTVICEESDGRRACRGAWYSDQVMTWLLDPPRSRFAVHREDERTVRIRRMEA